MTIAGRKSKATAWSRPTFRILLGSEAVTLSGSAVSAVALPAPAVLELRTSTSEVAALAFLGSLPNAVALWAGALSDRHPKRPRLIASDLVATGALVTVPAAAFAGMLTIGKLCAIVLGAAKVVHDAAAISLLPAVVDPDQLQDANAKLGAASSVADSAGTNAGAALAGRLRRDAGCLRRDHGRRYQRRGRCAARAQDRRPDRHRPHDHRRVRGQPSRPSTPAPRGFRAAVADRPGRHTGRAVVLGDGVRDQPTFPAPSRMRPLVPGPDAVRQYHSHRRARPLAAATAGSPVLALDVRTTLAIGALLQIVPVVLLLASPIRTLRKIPTRAAVPPAREGASS
ncbi:hypothetical protein [Streptomyces sp. S063]|uniref:hypothetical protein n=1 Tax=Streptomyces sp. S063 TaxID=2005885 RepID=UPI001F40C94A|nr:hypothetical protein [Streptomyces sp. S063]